MGALINFIKKISIILLGMLMWYLFIALCAWDLNPGEWGGFARFFFAIMSVLVIIFTVNDDF